MSKNYTLLQTSLSAAFQNKSGFYSQTKTSKNNWLTTAILAVSLFFVGLSASAQVTVTGALTGNGTYTTLGDAITAIGTVQTGAAINIDISGNTTEGTSSITVGAGTWATMTIQPAGGSWTITAATTAGSPMIDFSGADNVTINGLNTGGNALAIVNTTVSATSGTSTIRFIGGATSNTITNCNIQGSGTMAVGTNGATIFFSTDAVTANGNDNNTISNCNIGPAGSNFPTKAILGNGSTTTTAIGNSGNVINNNNIFDFFGAAVSSSGVATNGGCNTWSITNNRFYQTATRTWTTGATHRAIDINNSTATSGAQGFTITGNIVGYSSNSQTGTYTLTGSTGKFQGIFFNGITLGTVSNINSNTIAAVSLTGVTSSGITSAATPFSAIVISAGLANTNSNIIGSQSATGSLVFSTNSTTATSVYGIYNFSSDAWTANSNTIGGISVTNAAASGTFIVYGLRANTGTSVAFNATSNFIGGTIANSIDLSATGASSQVIGILSDLPAANLTTNTVRNLRTNIGTGTTTGASVIGMSLISSTPNHVLSQNTIFNLSNTNTTAASIVTGIQFTGSTANIVERNLIYGLTSATNSTSAEINGIRVGGGTTIYRNNMIALGAGVANSIGTAATNSNTSGINGINGFLGTDSFFHNSIYIGGSPTAGVGASYAFNGTQTTNTRSFRNNIFFNARSNNGATGKHYAVKINGTAANPTGLTINNNIYFTNGTGGVFGYFNSLDVATLAAWRTAVGQDAASFESNPQYLDATNAIPDLHLSPTLATLAEASGVDVSVAIDYDGQTRSGLTPTDIGADAGNFVAPVTMTYVSSTTTQANTSNVTTNAINQQVIGIQVLTSGASSPLSATSFTVNTNGTTSTALADIANAKLFYTGTNATFAASTQFGSTVAAPSGSHIVTGSQVLAEGTNYFWLTYDVPCGATANAVNVIDGECNSITIGSDQTPTVQAPTGSRLIVSGPLSGTKTVGTGGDYTRISDAFTAINSLGLGGNLVLSVISDITETASATLNQWSECGGSNFTLTIQPDAATVRTISVNVDASMIILNGADRVTVDGRFGGSGSFLSFINTNTPSNSASVFSFINGANNNMLRNLFMQSISGSLTGCVFFSTSSVAGGNSNNTITANKIRAYNGTNLGNVAIYSAGTVGNENSTNTISDNEIYSYSFRGLDITATGSTGWTITGNSFYNEIGVSFSAATNSLQGIRVQGGGNYTITGNYIGSNAPLAAGTNVSFTAPTTGLITYTGISLVATTGTSNIKGNVIKGVNISCVPTAASTIFSGISVSGLGIVNIGGDILGEGNTVGSNNANSNFIFTTTTAATTSTTQANGIVSSGAGNLIRGNQVGGFDINNLGAAPAATTFFGIVSLGTSSVLPMLITENIVGSTGSGASSNSIRFLSSSISTAPGIVGITHQVSTNAVSITNNTIKNITNQSTTSSGIFNGVFVSSSITNPVIITGNTIDAIGSVTNINGTSYVAITTANITSSINISSNTITNITQASTGASSTITGISHSGTAVATINQNTINNFSCAGTNTTLTAGVSSVQGIYLTGATSAGSTISQNTINNLSNTNTGAVSTNVSGIGFASSLSSPTITLNKIFGLSNLSTGTTVTAPPTVSGIIMRSANTNATVSNNMISLGDGQTSNTQFIGLWNNFTTTANLNIFYNSINISGTASSGSLPSYGIQRGNNSATAVTSPIFIKNNIFRNERTGGAGKHYAIANQATTASATGWTGSEMVTNAFRTSSASIGLWGAADQTFSDWIISTGGDASSINPVAITFVDGAIGNLDLVPNTNCALNGLATPLSITTDFYGVTRNATTPDIGAFEFNPTLPTITLGTSPSVCIGTTATNLTYSATTGSPNQYSINYDVTAEGQGFVDVVNATLPTTPIVLTVPSGAAAATYNATITVTNSTSGCVSAVQNVTVSVGPTKTYTAGSWTPSAPTSVDTAIISSNYNVAADITACALTVNNNAVVTIPAGNDVTLVGALTVSSGSFTLENTANLIQTTNASNTGNIIVRRNTSALMRSDYAMWSSPVTGQVLYGFSPLTFDNRFYQYVTVTNLYDNSAGFNITGLNPDGVNGNDSNNVQFTTAKGYLIRMPWNHPTAPAVWNGQFTGVPNNGNVAFAMTTGFNAVGNPYPSRLNVHNFIDGNTNISGPIYFWRKTNNPSATSYATLTKIAYVANSAAGGDTGTGFFNAGDELNWVINVGQGFIVQATSNNNLSFDNSMRRSSNSDQFFRNTTTVNTATNGLYWLNLTNSQGNFSQMAVGYSAEATVAEDRGIDGKNFNPEFFITSLIGQNEYAIQGRPEFTDTDVVPLSFKVETAGNYSITIDHTAGLFTGTTQAIYLRDNQSGSIHNLRAGAYNFVSAVGTFNNRFEVVYRSALGVENPSFNADQVVIYKNNVNDFVITSGNVMMASVRIFDIRGRLLAERKGINASQTTMTVGNSNEVLLVQVTSNQGDVVTKKVIR